MRPLLAIGVVVISLGTVYQYVSFVAGINHRAGSGFREISAEGRFHVDLTFTFDANADIFTTDSVLLQLHGGRELLRSQDPVSAGTILTIDPVEGIVVGANEFYLKVSTAEAEQLENDEFSLSPSPQDQEPAEAGGPSADKSRAVRIRVFRDDVLMVEQTFWSEPGQAVDGVLVIEVPGAGDQPAQHQHHEGLNQADS